MNHRFTPLCLPARPPSPKLCTLTMRPVTAPSALASASLLTWLGPAAAPCFGVMPPAKACSWLQGAPARALGQSEAAQLHSRSRRLFTRANGAGRCFLVRHQVSSRLESVELTSCPLPRQQREMVPGGSCSKSNCGGTSSRARSELSGQQLLENLHTLPRNSGFSSPQPQERITHATAAWLLGP